MAVNPRLFQVIEQVPSHISIHTWKDYATTVPKLKNIFHSAKEGNQSNYTLYLEYEDEHSKQSFPEGKEKLEILVDDYSLSVCSMNLDPPDEIFERKLPFLLLDQNQLETSPEASREFQIPNAGLPLLKCGICWEVIVKEEAFAVPCMTCDRAICGNCIRLQFQAALKDHERMPVVCCRQPLHPDVAKDIIPAEQRAKYKLRYQEMSAKRPFYCPTPTCSTFIPPRKLRVVQGKVKCHSCKSPICWKCRTVAAVDHICTDKQREEDAMLQKFGYKRCPSCRMGQAKMFGCNHLRCMCGTHWCWRCAWPLHECRCNYQGEDINGNAADSESDEIGWDDSDDESADTPESSVIGTDELSEKVGTENDIPVGKEQHQNETNVVEEACLNVSSEEVNAGAIAQNTHLIEADSVATVQEHVSADETQAQADPTRSTSEDTVGNANDTAQSGEDAQPAVTEVVENLDEPSYAWDNAEYDFGTDPGELTDNPWTCSHKDILPLTKDMLNRYWAGALDKEWWERNDDGSWERLVDCMLCLTPAKMKIPEVVQKEEYLVNAGKTEQNLAVDASEVIKAQKAAKENAYWCRDCGTIACGRCKTVIDIHLERAREKTTV